jgi:hypothetical protein
MNQEQTKRLSDLAEKKKVPLQLETLNPQP